jgi:hypothetical protein
MSQFELLKKLEYLVAFQTSCLAKGNWEEFDLTENQVRKLENQILGTNQEGRSPEPQAA